MIHILVPDDAAVLKAARAQVEAHGLRLSCVEGGPPMDKIILGAPGRDEQIENFNRCVRAMGEAGIPILCCTTRTLPLSRRNLRRCQHRLIAQSMQDEHDLLLAIAFFGQLLLIV